jgi:WD40 repeat protein
MLLTGDAKNVLRQWKIEEDNLILISKRENAHDNWINVLLNLGDGHIASGSDDYTIKIW